MGISTDTYGNVKTSGTYNVSDNGGLVPQKTDYSNLTGLSKISDRFDVGFDGLRTGEVKVNADGSTETGGTFWNSTTKPVFQNTQKLAGAELVKAQQKFTENQNTADANRTDAVVSGLGVGLQGLSMLGSLYFANKNFKAQKDMNNWKKGRAAAQDTRMNTLTTNANSMFG